MNERIRNESGLETKKTDSKEEATDSNEQKATLADSFNGSGYEDPVGLPSLEVVDALESLYIKYDTDHKEQFFDTPDAALHGMAEFARSKSLAMRKIADLVTQEKSKEQALMDADLLKKVAGYLIKYADMYKDYKAKDLNIDQFENSFPWYREMMDWAHAHVRQADGGGE